MNENNTETKTETKYTFKPKKITKKEMDEITKEIDKSLEEFIKEGKYKDVLISMGNLGHYSLNNQIYIIMQKPDAITTYGMKKWNALGRHIKPGEKSIKIFTPIIKKIEEKDKNDENKVNTKYALTGFQRGYVFDISQTEGKEINTFRFDENKLVEDKTKILEGLRKTISDAGFSVSYASKEELGDGCYGLCNHNSHEIKILEGMSDLQEISTTVHECGHALAHSAYREDFEGLTVNEKREIKEVEAESIACIVCTYLGLDTKNFNFSYITGWANGDISKFRKNIDVISKHANTLIKGIEKEFVIEKAIEEKSKEVSPIPINLQNKNNSREVVME